MRFLQRFRKGEISLFNAASTIRVDREHNHCDEGEQIGDRENDICWYVPGPLGIVAECVGKTEDECSDEETEWALLSEEDHHQCYPPLPTGDVRNEGSEIEGENCTRQGTCGTRYEKGDETVPIRLQSERDERLLM